MSRFLGWVASLAAIVASSVFVYGPNVSCGPVPCLLYAIDDRDFPPEEQKLLRNGVRRFNEFVGQRRFDIDVGRVDDCVVRKRWAPRSTLDDGGIRAEWGGLHRKWERQILIDYEETRIEVTFMHELGHAAGMAHIPKDFQGVMNPDDAANDYTWADRNECETSGICLINDRPR